jgi:hypothetical protein
MTPRERLAALLAGQPTDRLIVDVCTTTLTARRPTLRPRSNDGLRYADAIMHLPILSDEELAALGAQTRRCGPSFPGADIDPDDGFEDYEGVRWIWADGEPAPVSHPLADANFQQITARQRPSLLEFVAPTGFGKTDRPYVLLADVPRAGLLDSAFRLRGYFELLEDTVDRWPIANALFDRVMDGIVHGYEEMLAALPDEADIVVYGDDLAYQGDLYLSEERFAFFLRPRMARIFGVIRSLTRAEILFHSCGAALPVLKEVVEMGVRIVNFQPTAKGMEIASVRRALGPTVIFHGVLDFVALATALRNGDRAAIEIAIDDIVAGWPMIAAPVDNLPASLDPDAIHRVTAFLAALDIPRLLGGDRTQALESAFGLSRSFTPDVSRVDSLADRHGLSKTALIQTSQNEVCLELPRFER